MSDIVGFVLCTLEAGASGGTGVMGLIKNWVITSFGEVVKPYCYLIYLVMSRTSKTNPPKPAVSLTSCKGRLTTEDYEELKNTFEVFDEDGSGSIDPEEINKVVEELGLDKRNPFILSLIHALKEKNRAINFNDFLDIICSKVGETKTKDGLRRVFALFDQNEDGVVDFEELKAICKQLHENMNDDEILEMMHSTHIQQKTSTNEHFTFDEFYSIVSKFANK